MHVFVTWPIAYRLSLHAHLVYTNTLALHNERWIYRILHHAQYYS